MTVTTNERGQQNMWALEPRMYVSKEDAEKYGLETYSERAEKLNGRAAMMGILGLMVHEGLNNDPYVINSLLGYPVAFNAGF